MKAMFVGQQVKLATHLDMIFVVTKINSDHSYAIQAQSNMAAQLSYDHVVAEMLCVVDAKK